MKCNFWRKFLAISLILATLLPTFFTDSLQNNLLPSESILDMPTSSSFSEENYKPVLEAPEQGLGNITLTKMSFDETGIFNQSTTYPELVDDLSSGALLYSYLGTNFIETKEIAQFDNLDESKPVSQKIVILINESISIEYNHSIAGSEGFLIYNPRLYPRNLKNVYIQNSTSDQIEELDENDYSVDENDFLIFDYIEFFGVDFHNFSLYILFEYTLNLQEWSLEQDPADVLEITQQEQAFIPSFSYNFTLSGTKFFKNLTITPIPADNLYVELIVNPSDKDDFLEHELKIDDITINDFLEPDNSINVSMSAGYSSFYLAFKLNFTIKFEDPVDYSWAIDRLHSGRDIRERIYIPSLITGPKHIFLSKVYFIESTLIYDQIQTNSSTFGRDVNYFDTIISLTQNSAEYSLIFTRNAVKRKGLKIFLPYLIAGETNPLSLQYKASNDLRIILTDNIRMPLIDYRIELYYFNILFGTYISNQINQPMAPAYSNENGELLIENVPNGNYTVKVFDGNSIVAQKQIDTFSQVNLISTNVLQFPLWIVIFGSISGILLLIGFILYFKKRK